MATFGVAEAQVRRDHAISHILGALSRHRREDLIFFGGTALSRTYPLDKRLSEDIDLIAVDHREDLAGVLLKDINTALARTHGQITWSPDGIAIKIQLLSGARYEPWPTQTREIEQRYRDAPSATLPAPTLLAFAGWKTAAWLDRGVSRVCPASCACHSTADGARLNIHDLLLAGAWVGVPRSAGRVQQLRR
jgi:hypothetical protein